MRFILLESKELKFDPELIPKDLLKKYDKDSFWAKSNDGEKEIYWAHALEQWDKDNGNLCSEYLYTILESISAHGEDPGKNLFLYWVLNADDDNLKALDASSAKIFNEAIEKKTIDSTTIKTYLLKSDNKFFEDANLELKFRQLITILEEGKNFKNSDGEEVSILDMLDDSGKVFLSSSEIEEKLEAYSDGTDGDAERDLGEPLSKILKKNPIASKNDYTKDPTSFVKNYVLGYLWNKYKQKAIKIANDSKEKITLETDYKKFSTEFYNLVSSNTLAKTL